MKNSWELHPLIKVSVFTLEEQISRYAENLTFWLMKLDEVKLIHPKDIKEREQFIKTVILNTMLKLNATFPEDVVKQINKQSFTMKTLHKHIITNFGTVK